MGLQLDLMESAFISLNLDQPANWEHPGNHGWRVLFRRWAGTPPDGRKRDPNVEDTRFIECYRFLGQRHSGRFLNFCEQTLKLPSLWEEMT